jgi:hypothetical protein
VIEDPALDMAVSDVLHALAGGGALDPEGLYAGIADRMVEELRASGKLREALAYCQERGWICQDDAGRWRKLASIDHDHPLAVVI